jgi:transposase InsO family protein
MKFEFIEARKAQYPVVDLCRVLRVSRSGFYAWSKREESVRARENRRLGLEVKAAFTESKGRYGSPRLWHQLRAAGVQIGRHRTARLMREHKLKARARRRFTVTTDSRHSLPTASNLLERDFTADAPDRVWVADVTFLPTREGWLYLAVVLDLFSRRVVGFAMSARNDESLTISALTMALEMRRPAPGLIHHSDRGTTYASGGYQELLGRHGAQCSMSRKGDCWDNAVAESFFSTLDFECESADLFPSRATARHLVLEYILSFYNPTRLHSTLGYRSPAEYEAAA